MWAQVCLRRCTFSFCANACRLLEASQNPHPRPLPQLKVGEGTQPSLHRAAAVPSNLALPFLAFRQSHKWRAYQPKPKWFPSFRNRNKLRSHKAWLRYSHPIRQGTHALGQSLFFVPCPYLREGEGEVTRLDPRHWFHLQPLTLRQNTAQYHSRFAVRWPNCIRSDRNKHITGCYSEAIKPSKRRDTKASATAPPAYPSTCAFWKHNLNCQPLQRARNCGRDQSSMIAGDGPVKFHDRALPESAPLAFIATLTISSKAPAAIAGF